MKPSSWDKQLGSPLPLKSAASQSDQTNNPSKDEVRNEVGAGCKSPRPHLSEGLGESFFLDILFHRMSALSMAIGFLFSSSDGRLHRSFYSFTVRGFHRLLTRKTDSRGTSLGRVGLRLRSAARPLCLSARQAAAAGRMADPGRGSLPSLPSSPPRLRELSAEGCLLPWPPQPQPAALRAQPRGRSLSPEDEHRRGQSPLPQTWSGGGILSRLDQVQTGAAAIPRARIGQSQSRNVVGGTDLQHPNSVCAS